MPTVNTHTSHIITIFHQQIKRMCKQKHIYKVTPAIALPLWHWLRLTLLCLAMSACSLSQFSKADKPNANKEAGSQQPKTSNINIAPNKNDLGAAPDETIYLISDINIGPKGSDPALFLKANGSVFFSADDGIHGRELWKSNQSGSKVALVKDINTIKVDSPNTPNKTSSAFPSSLTELNDTLMFAADNGILGKELWKSDGTDAGTVLVKDINTATTPNNSSYPSYLTTINGIAYFAANDGIHGNELWKSDGTTENTIMIKDIHVGAGDSSPTNLTNVNGILYFSANDGVNGIEVWKSDGTEAGTVMVNNINKSGHSLPNSFTQINDLIYFIANDGVYGKELWQTDGTSIGTNIVKDINTSQGVNNGNGVVSELYNINNTLYFSANDTINGTELWKSDGTYAGTVLVKDVNPGKGDAQPSGFTLLGSALLFAANDGSNGTELWTSNGTATGTRLVKNINNNPNIKAGSSYPTALTTSNGKLYFAADDGSGLGEELWHSNGTMPGTTMIKNISHDATINAGGSNPRDLIDINGILFFSAYKKAIGRELFRIDSSTTQKP